MMLYAGDTSKLLAAWPMSHGHTVELLVSLGDDGLLAEGYIFGRALSVSILMKATAVEGILREESAAAPPVSHKAGCC